MEPPIWAMRTGTSGSGFLVTIRSVVGFTAWTLSSVANPDCTTVLPGTMLRSYTALTSSAVSGEDVKAVYERNMVPGKTVVQSGFATLESVQAEIGRAHV